MLQLTSEPQTWPNGGSGTNCHDGFHRFSRICVYSCCEEILRRRRRTAASAQIREDEGHGFWSTSPPRDRYSAGLWQSTVWYGVLVTFTVRIHNVLGTGAGPRAANVARMGGRRSSYVGCDTYSIWAAASPKT